MNAMPYLESKLQVVIKKMRCAGRGRKKAWGMKRIQAIGAI